MIDEEILRELVPATEPNVEDDSESLMKVEGEFHRRTERWCKAIQDALPNYFRTPKENPQRTGAIPENVALIGIGFFPVPEYFSHRRRRAGLSFGVVMYDSNRRTEPFEMKGLVARRQNFPVVSLPVDFEFDGSLGNGRCSAVLSDNMGEFLLTADHCVSSVPRGNHVVVNCLVCGQAETATLEKRGHIYLDLALLRRSPINCGCSYTPTRSVALGARSMTVKLHNRSLGSFQNATIMQGIGSPSSVINGASPQTFTIDVTGSSGDSGCAISSNNALVGSYTGRLSVGTSATNAVSQGYAHCADEALRLFNCSLKEGIF